MVHLKSSGMPMRLSGRQHLFDLAEDMFLQLDRYTFDVGSVSRYPEVVLSEIRHGVEAIREVNRTDARWLFRYSEPRAIDIALNGDDPLEREQACWELAQYSDAALDTLLKSATQGGSAATSSSILLAARKVAYQNPRRYLSELNNLRSQTTKDELSDWARISWLEHAYLRTQDASVFDAACIADEAIEKPRATFDVTMPLRFECTAEVRIGNHKIRMKLSPAYFEQAIGQAMACLCRKTYETDLILEKTIPGIHPDGSPHYEHFLFSGTTERLGTSLFRHNYWANIRRPYYTSCLTESVSALHPVIPNVPMTFARMAMTTAPKRYHNSLGPAPESVRGVFFGFGHIPPWQVLKRGFRIKAGDFQITGRKNPHTGKDANTHFFGTFYGKLVDRAPDGRIVLNARPTHCTPAGALDYHGNGTMMPDPNRPSDWPAPVGI